MMRREFIAAMAGFGAALSLPVSARASGVGAWRRYEVTTHLSLPKGQAGQAWVPVPSLDDPLWSRPGDTRWTGSAGEVSLLRSGDAGMVHAVWTGDEAEAVLEVTSEITTRDRSVDLTMPAQALALSPAERAHHTAPTALIPTDGIVAETAEAAVGRAQSDLEKARRLYDWVVAETERNPETRGCGLGDVASMLQMGDLTGKCADLNALYVGLARSVDLPARDLYGIRVAPSDRGYHSLGAKDTNITGAQHCRADVWLEGFGWVPADPADVRKVALQEPEKQPDAEAMLFGAAEGNWIAYNAAHDVVLPGAGFGPVPFLMYPMAEFGGRRLDELDPEGFAYTITAREMPV
ncbi:transglutaminase domain-containing protein [Palleronia caenipelagi]|uniref:Transglutaminase domain-containing protein n=2 Tax=Palleronia caenipelagi TaxID=2489174 RepID=A0A547Q2Q1_9RHOB|nr:transglutaminase domain-containing protein [Palleronia caenipelagi]